MARPRVGLWRIDLGKGAPATAPLLALLDAGERRRAAAFVRSADGDAFVRSHAALRLLLAARLKRQPDAIPLGVPEPDGKPRVEPQYLAGKALDFSLSHSGTEALVGIVEGGGQIGVDLEARGLPADWRALAERHFTADERRWLLALPPTEQGFRFLQIWTRKEAYLKAIGKGFSRPPSSFRCRLDEDGAVVGTAHDGAGRALPRWRVVRLDRPPVAACAVIDVGTPLEIRTFHWPRAAPSR